MSCGRSGGVLGAFWAVLGASWGRLGASWGRMGAFCGRLGVSQLRLGASWGSSGASCGRRGGFGIDFGRFCSLVFGMMWKSIFYLVHLAKHCQALPSIAKPC